MSINIHFWSARDKGQMVLINGLAHAPSAVYKVEEECIKARETLGL